MNKIYVFEPFEQVTDKNESRITILCESTEEGRDEIFERLAKYRGELQSHGVLIKKAKLEFIENFGIVEPSSYPWLIGIISSNENAERWLDDFVTKNKVRFSSSAGNRRGGSDVDYGGQDLIDKFNTWESA